MCVSLSGSIHVAHVSLAQISFKKELINASVTASQGGYFPWHSADSHPSQLKHTHTQSLLTGPAEVPGVISTDKAAEEHKRALSLRYGEGEKDSQRMFGCGVDSGEERGKNDKGCDKRRMNFLYFLVALLQCVFCVLIGL